MPLWVALYRNEAGHTSKDLVCLIHAGFVHTNRLEAALERRVLLYVLAVLIQSSCTHALQLAAGQSRLQNVGCINRPLCCTSSDQSVYLIDHLHMDDVTCCSFTSYFPGHAEFPHVSRRRQIVTRMALDHSISNSHIHMSDSSAC